MGLLPFRDDNKSINFLKQRERNRKHWNYLNEGELLEKTTRHYLKVKKAILKNINNIIYVENLEIEEIIEKMVEVIKNGN